jgi:hypothetical protein
MRYVVDIDGTICNTNGNDYENSVPIYENIYKINQLHNEGHEIIYHTSRGTSSGNNHYITTIIQLARWGAIYDELRMGKMSYDHWIDDKSFKIEQL